MARIYLTSVEVCDANKVKLPFQNSGYVAGFDPAPLGTTATLNLRVNCNVVPDINIQSTFILDIGFPDNYRFTMGTFLSIQYTRQVTSGADIYLSFQLANIKPLNASLPCDLRLQVRETISTIQTPPLIVRIYGN